MKISTEGHRHLGSVTGSKQFSEYYISSLITQYGMSLKTKSREKCFMNE